MPLLVPFTPSLPNYRFNTGFDGTIVTFQTLWNARDAAWYFDLFAADASIIALGIKVVLGVNLGRKSTHPFFFSNLLRAYDTSNQGRDAGIDDLGARVQVVRFSLAELLFGPQTQ
jgi:hypothetical protein